MRQLLLSLLPIQALAFGLPAINLLLNGFVVGHYLGASALAAVGFIAPLSSLSSMLNSMLSNGSQIRSGQDLGRGDREGMAKIFNSTIAFALAAGLFLTLILMTFNRGIVSLMGASAELTEITRAYLLGMAPSILFGVLFSVMLSFMQLERAEKESGAAVIVLVAVNTVLNFLNVYVLHWGLFGAGLSTSLANFIAVAVSLPYFLRKSPSFRFSLRKIDFMTLKSVLYIGMPSAILPACGIVRDRILNYFVFTLGGTPAMAAMTVAHNITTAVGWTLEGGYSGSANLITSVLVGERDIESLRALPKTMVTAMFPIYGAAYALIFLFARPLALLFGAETEYIGLYALAIRCSNLWFLTNTLKTPTLAIYRALGRIGLVNAFQMLTLLVLSPLAMASGMLFGLPVVYNADWIAEALLIIVFSVYYTIRRGRLPDSIFKLTDIPDTLAVPSADRFSATIRNVADAMQASGGITDFCKRKGLPPRTAMLYGLCVEELAVDTLFHGFSRDKKGMYSIELRAICENGEVTLMLRDNCPHFDPNEWLAIHADPDDERSLGIRLAAKSAKEMNYTSALGMNVVTIRI